MDTVSSPECFLIMVVDDEKTERIIRREILEQHNFLVCEAVDGLDAMKKLNQVKPDLIMLDVNMPGQDGFATCRAIRSDFALTNIPIIMVTGNDDTETINKAFDAGATDYMTKPLNIKVIIRRIRVIIDSCRFNRAILERKDVLESIVRERTAELDRVNRKLKRERDLLEIRVVDRTKSLQQANEKISREKEQLAVTLRSIEDGVITTDSSGNINMLNPTAEKFICWTTEEVAGRPLAEVLQLVSKDDQHSANRLLKQILSEKIAVLPEKKFILTGRDKNRHPVTFSAAPIRNNQRTIGFVLVFRDMSEQQKAEELLIHGEKMTTIADMATGVAHELNTPLSAILQSIQVIEECFKPDNDANGQVAADCGINLSSLAAYLDKKEIYFFFKGIRDSAVKAAKIIDNLLRLSRTDSGEMIKADITDILDNSVEMAVTDYQFREKYNIVNFKITREYQDIPQVTCNPLELEQVFLNIIKNAAQAMRNTTRPCLILKSAENNGMACVEIIDNGRGIDEEDCRRIFEPNFAFGSSGNGMGMGLFVSHRIIHDKHQGTIRVDSTGNKGATFTICLPVNQKETLSAERYKYKD